MSLLTKEESIELTRISEILNKIHVVNNINTYSDRVDAIANGRRWSGSTWRKVSLPDIIKDHEENIERVELMKKAYEVASVEVQKATVILNKYEKCKKCNGGQGSWSDQGGYDRRKTWNDCEWCDGHGYVPNRITGR